MPTASADSSWGLSHRALGLLARMGAAIALLLAFAPGAFAQSSADGLVALGRQHSCILNTAGAVQCWGANDYGQTTVPAPTSGVFASIGAGLYHTCAVTTTGALQCWGWNGFGQTTVPAPTSGVFASVSAGYYHTCAVTTTGALQCWGANDQGQSTVPAPTSGVFASVGVAPQHTCAVTTAGDAQCWGYNIGDQTTVPAPVSGVFASVSGGLAHTCALTTTGALQCWGNNNDGRSTPPAGTFKSVSVGYYHACAVATTGALQCWGLNHEGQLNGIPAGAFSSLDVDNSQACAVTTAGTVQCWGYNGNGQTTVPGTLGTVGRRLEPVRASLSADYDYTCAVRPDGTLACWGRNVDGQATPPSGTFASVSAGGFHTCAVRPDGTLTCWGRNVDSQATPPSGTFASVSAGTNHTCAVRPDGTLACWGRNVDSQATPPSGTFTSVSAGNVHTCAVSTDGTLACWGDNSVGQTNAPAIPMAFRSVGAPGPDLSLTFSNGSGTAPSVTAYVRPGQVSASAVNPVRRLWHVTPTGGTPGWTARVRLAYLDSELPAGADESALRVGKTQDGSTWEELTVVGRSTTGNWIEVDVTSFSTFAVVAGDGVLPVELTSFAGTVSGRTAHLSWTTASETNNIGFVVERQTGDAWTDVSALIAGQGTTTERTDYAYDVTNLTTGRHTFRLRQTDTDGAIHHSESVTIEIGTDGLGALVTILGNGSRTPKLRIEGSGAVRAEVFDVLGRSVATVYDGLVSGTAEARLLSLSSGSYVVRVTSDGRMTSHAVVVR